jgi:hypothetical protein
MVHHQAGNQRFSVIPARAISDPELSDGAIRTLAVLGMFTDRNGWCYPSYATLAKIRGISKSAIAKHITELSERGYLNVHHRFDENGARRSNLLQVRFDFPYEQSPVQPEASAGSGEEASHAPPPVHLSEHPVHLIGEHPVHLIGEHPVHLKGKRLTIPINDINSSSSSSAGVAENHDFPAEAGDVERAETLYRLIRPGHLGIPRTHWYEGALQVLNQVLAKHGGDSQAAAEYLRQYAEEADRRGIAQTNLCWLVEWAAAGDIPKPQADRRPTAGTKRRSSAAAPHAGEPKPREISEAEAEKLRARFALHAQQVQQKGG